MITSPTKSLHATRGTEPTAETQSNLTPRNQKRQTLALHLHELPPIAVNAPTTVTRKTEMLINDLICVFLGTPENLERELHAAPLTMFVTKMPHTGSAELIMCMDVLLAPKLVAKGIPAKAQSVRLGVCNTLAASVPPT